MIEQIAAAADKDEACVQDRTGPHRNEQACKDADIRRVQILEVSIKIAQEQRPPADRRKPGDDMYDIFRPVAAARSGKTNSPGRYAKGREPGIRQIFPDLRPEAPEAFAD